MSGLNASGGAISSGEQAELVKSALRYNFELFSGGSEIWSDQCYLAASRIDTVKVLVQDYCMVFSNDACFRGEETARQVSSDFIVTLYYVCDQLEELQNLITAFQPMCRTSSKQGRKKRAEILSKLELFKLHSDDLLAFLEIETHQKRSPFCRADVELVSVQEKKGHRRLQHIVGGKSDQLPTEKRRSHLVVVKEGYLKDESDAFVQ